MNIESTVSGIPCLIKVGRCIVKKGNYSLRAETPDEYFWVCEIEFEVLDRKGYPAPWLERKLTDDDTNRIETQILEYQDDDC